MIANIIDIPAILIKKGLPFAIYSLPLSDSFTLIFQNNDQIKKVDILDIEEVSGFIIASFDSAKTREATIITPDFVVNDGDNYDDIKKFLDKIPENGDYNFLDNISLSKADYLDRATYLISKLKENELQKVVFSRVVQKHLKKNLKIKSLLRILRDKYKGAFINLFHLPGKGTWCGASPETLFKIVDDNVLTDALAGTRLINENKVNPIWTHKEKEEQYFVSLFIESLLSELGIHEYEQKGPVSMVAGNIAHLQTKFSIPTSSLLSKKGKFIAGLHPTPAVCGLPKAEAYLLIQKAEQHQRRYYSGFIGPWKLNGQSQLFVNLRCAELGKNKINIYVGGGLTASSNPEDEYQETVHKSQTLLSVVENL